MTPERFRRLKAALLRRQPDLTVLMERVNKSHNFSAILRNCDATGVLEAHVVPPRGRLPTHFGTSAGSAGWVPVRRHDSTAEAFRYLRERGFSVVAAHLDPGAIDYREVDFTRPTAVLMGAELFGISEEALGLADQTVTIPMEGLVQSLNVSVATALLLYEARRQREAAGMYLESRIPPELFAARLFEWCYPREARRFRESGDPYPQLDEEGRWLDDAGSVEESVQ